MKHYLLLLTSVVVGTVFGLFFSQLMYAQQIVPDNTLALTNNLQQNIIL